MKEIFKDIKGFEGLYQIGNYGTVKSLVRKVRSGNGIRVISEAVKKHGKNSGGYSVVNLFKDSKCYPNCIHRLLAAHFIPNPLNLPEVNHINGIKTDNSLQNLEWCTYSHNLKHAYDIGLRRKIPPLKNKFNEEHPRSKKIAQYSLTGELIRVWPCSKEVHRETGFNHHNIRNCANGRAKTANGFTWKFISYGSN